MSTFFFHGDNIQGCLLIPKKEERDETGGEAYGPKLWFTSKGGVEEKSVEPARRRYYIHKQNIIN